jgi:hypothetical protein
MGGALGAATGRPDPVTVTAHSLSPVEPCPVDRSTVVVKVGKRYTTGSAVLRSDEGPLLSLLGTFGDLADGGGSLLVDESPPDRPPVEECIRLPSSDTFPPPVQRPGRAPPAPHGCPVCRRRAKRASPCPGWFRLPEGEAVDTAALLLALDTYSPTMRNSDLPVGWTPTMELTAHVLPGRCRVGRAVDSPPGSSAVAPSRRTGRSGTKTVDRCRSLGSWLWYRAKDTDNSRTRCGLRWSVIVPSVETEIGHMADKFRGVDEI